MDNDQAGQDQIVTPFVRRHLQQLHEGDVEFKQLGKQYGIKPSTLSTVRDGGVGVGAKLRPNFAKLMGFADEGELVDAAVRAYVLGRIGARGADSLEALDGKARAMATANLLTWVGEDGPRARLKLGIDSEPDPTTAGEAPKKARPARR